MTHGRQSGFTFIEILVSIAIFAIIAVISHGILGQYLNTQENLKKNSQSLQSYQRLFTLLERDLRYISTRSVRDEYGDSEPAFIASNSYGLEGELMRFTTSLPNYDELYISTLKRVVWRIEDGDVYRGQWPVLDHIQNTEINEAKILSRIASIDVTYFEWSDTLGVQQTDFSQTEEHEIPYGIEVLLTTQDDITYKRIFDFSNGT